ncbi:CDGSH iron-sulfur domain-containing protein [Streptomyces sparsus]
MRNGRNEQESGAVPDRTASGPARTAPDESAGTDAASGDGTPAAKAGRARRVTVEPEGPVLVEGPVEVELADGGIARSDRFVVALCTCRRSRRYPWCDTSHRRRTRKNEPPTDPGGERPARS